MKKNGFAPIIILILLVLIAGGAYYFGTKNKTVPVAPVASAQPSSSPSPNPIVGSTTNWKTYTNKNFNYSIKYPQQFGLDDRGYPQIHISLISTGPGDWSGLGDINIYSWDPTTNCDTDAACFKILQDVYNGAKSAGSKVDYSSFNTTISGRSVKAIEAWDLGVVEGGTFRPSSLTYEYPLSVNGNLFELEFVIDNYKLKSQAETQKQLVDQILPTFHFLK